MPVKTESIVADLKVQVAKTDEWMRQTVEYRAKLCSRFDRMEDKLDSLCERLATMPCAVHVKIMENMEKRLNSHSSSIGKIWAVVGAVVLTIFTIFIGHAFGAK